MLMFMFSLVTMEKNQNRWFSMEIILKLVSLKFWTLLQGSLNAVGAVGPFSMAVPKAILDVCRFSQICLLCLKVSRTPEWGDLVPHLPPGSHL